MSRRDEQFESCGITWEAVDFSGIGESTTERSVFRFVRSLPELVWNTAALEGNTFTLPEVRTLLDGVTVGGRPVEDATQILDLSAAYRALAELVESGTFAVSKAVSDRLHLLVARNEAIDAGLFRGEGRSTGGGTVLLASGGVVAGRDHGPDGILLSQAYQDLLDYLFAAVADPREQALAYFAAAVRDQLYFDGNKRTARLMMTGHLMAAGFEAVAIPWARRLEFNNALDRLFTTNDATELMSFVATCAVD